MLLHKDACLLPYAKVRKEGEYCETKMEKTGACDTDHPIAGMWYLVGRTRKRTVSGSQSERGDAGWTEQRRNTEADG